MIPVYKPWLTDLERKYVNEAVESSWISSTGKYIQKAEELFADFVGVKHAVTTTSGTTALHLCIKSTSLTDSNSWGRNLKFIVPNTTFAATAFAVDYDNRGGIVFADADIKTWNLSIEHVEYLCQQQRIDAVLPVHLYGNPVDMDGLKLLQEKYKFYIIEDACESIGAKINGQMTGSIGDIGCFSFYGNKTLTSGEGGMVVTNDDEMAERVRFLRGQAQDPNKRYWHLDIGHNYRMTNLQAAVLCGQLERSEEILAEKARVANRYLENLAHMQEVKFQKVLPGHEHSYWMVSALLATNNKTFSAWMRDNGVDTRKVFYPLTDMPPWNLRKHTGLANSKILSSNGVSFPSYPELTNAEIDKICSLVKKYFLF
jgi:perosamine synthetase